MPRMMHTGPERRVRRGMTLVEIMIALVLLGIISGVIMRVITRQQRFYQGVNQIMSQRGQLRQATSVLPVDLRSLSSIGDDIKVATDSSMEFMVTVGAGVICELPGGGSQIVLPPDTLKSTSQVLTSWYGYGPPNASVFSYQVYVYNDSNVAGNEDDRWQPFTLVKAEPKMDKCLITQFNFKAADLGHWRYVLTLSSSEPNDASTGGPLSRWIEVGAPVRVVRRVKYALYQAPDGKWYLGFANMMASTGTYDELSPVSGPYDPYGSASGLGFRYYDVDGNEIASNPDSAGRSKIARVDLIARARTSGNVRAAGIQNGASQQYRDSLAVSVMLRNRQ